MSRWKLEECACCGNLYHKRLIVQVDGKKYYKEHQPESRGLKVDTNE